jgi:hypothetical protein
MTNPQTYAARIRGLDRGTGAKYSYITGWNDALSAAAFIAAEADAEIERLQSAPRTPAPATNQSTTQERRR